MSERDRAKAQLVAAISENDQSYGLGLMRMLGFHGWRLYPHSQLLDELLAEGIIESYQESQPEDRPARTLFRLVAGKGGSK